MSLRVAPWWAEAVAALKTRPLAEVAQRFGVEADELRVALIEAGVGGAADAAPWWPEAMRLRASTSLRAIARMFGTEPRRIRRALARTGVRVHGEELGGRGVRALKEARLGTRPDGEIAKTAGLIPEAVQGERRRQRIPAFRPRAQVKLSVEEEAWARGEARPKRERAPAAQPEVLQVVRRSRPPGPSPVAAAPSSARSEVPRRAEPAPPVVTRREVRPQVAPVRTETNGRLATPPRAEPPRAEMNGRIATPPRAEALGRVATPARTEPPRAEPPGAAPPRAARPEPPPEPVRELDQLLRPGPPREGRMRLVRIEPAPRPRLEEVPPPRRERAPRPEVRRVLVPEILFAEGAREADATWHVHLPGEDAPLVVIAADLVRAVNAAATVLPWEVLQGVRVERVELDARR